MKELTFASIEQLIGNTPLVEPKRLPVVNNNRIILKLEGQNPAGSVKDRPALSMIVEAEKRGDISPGDRLIEATSGNTGIALAMVAAIRGYKMRLVMPDTLSQERFDAMAAYGAEIVTVSGEQGMEGARDLALRFEQEGQGKVLNQFANSDNPWVHYRTTGPEIWQATQGQITHFVSSMGTTGTIMGVSRYLKQQNPAIEIIGVQPADNACIPGIRRWPKAYLPAIFDADRVDRIVDIGQQEAEQTTRDLARGEGIFAGVSSGGTLAAALQIQQSLHNALIVTIVCDRGDRYLSTGVFNG